MVLVIRFWQIVISMVTKGKLLQEAISTLPEVQRTVFIMKYYDGLKYPEIHEILGTSEGALKASYHIAVKKILQYIKENE